MTDQSALIIGASRGLGLALAAEYLRRGFRVVATVRGDAPAALSFLKVVAERALKDPIDSLHLLLLTKLMRVFRGLLLHTLVVHSRRVVAALDAALLAVAARALQI